MKQLGAPREMLLQYLSHMDGKNYEDKDWIQILQNYNNRNENVTRTNGTKTTSKSNIVEKHPVSNRYHDRPKNSSRYEIPIKFYNPALKTVPLTDDSLAKSIQSSVRTTQVPCYSPKTIPFNSHHCSPVIRNAANLDAQMLEKKTESQATNVKPGGKDGATNIHFPKLFDAGDIHDPGDRFLARAETVFDMSFAHPMTKFSSIFEKRLLQVIPYAN